MPPTSGRRTASPRSSCSCCWRRAGAARGGAPRSSSSCATWRGPSGRDGRGCSRRERSMTPPRPNYPIPRPSEPDASAQATAPGPGDRRPGVAGRRQRPRPVRALRQRRVLRHAERHRGRPGRARQALSPRGSGRRRQRRARRQRGAVSSDRSGERGGRALSGHPAGPVPRGAGDRRAREPRRRRHVRCERGPGQARRELHAARGRRGPQAGGGLAAHRGGRRRGRAVSVEIGHFALVLAFALALVQGTLPLWGAARGDAGLIELARSSALGQFVFLTVAFGALIHAFALSDFSVVNVAANSHSTKPLIYKIAAAWGNHEGSLVLWVWILALYGCGVALFGRNLPPAFRARVLAVQGLIGVGFLAFMLLTSNPFLRVDPAPIDGRGFNPILQAPALAAHPPMLYAGYVGLSMAFAFAIAALIEGRVDATWARWVRPWTLAAWCSLSFGIALGSYWAYYELGWGGWWFWDPVENASFMPWLAATALLHSAVVVEKRDALKSWTILLAILAFSLSLLGTFLVRSGVLTSVHAFAVDPARGVFVL